MRNAWDKLATTDAQEYEGLCMTCNSAPACAFRKRGRGPVLQCEEFDDYQALTAGSEPAAARKLRGHNPADAGRYKGLCINCDFRETCINAASETGVWHCENYQ